MPAKPRTPKTDMAQTITCTVSQRVVVTDAGTFAGWKTPTKTKHNPPIRALKPAKRMRLAFVIFIARSLHCGLFPEGMERPRSSGPASRSHYAQCVPVLEKKIALNVLRHPVHLVTWIPSSVSRCHVLVHTTPRMSVVVSSAPPGIGAAPTAA